MLIPVCGSICKTHFWKRQVREKAQVAARVDWGEAADTQVSSITPNLRAHI